MERPGGELREAIELWVGRRVEEPGIPQRGETKVLVCGDPGDLHRSGLARIEWTSSPRLTGSKGFWITPAAPSARYDSISRL